MLAVVHADLAVNGIFSGVCFDHSVAASMFATSRCRHDWCITADSIPHDLVILSEPPQDCFVDVLPNTCLHPFLKATPACHAIAAAKLTRQVLPRYSGSEDNRIPVRAARLLI
jgi:hypothetical protein